MTMDPNPAQASSLIYPAASTPDYIGLISIPPNRDNLTLKWQPGGILGPHGTPRDPSDQRPSGLWIGSINHHYFGIYLLSIYHS